MCVTVVSITRCCWLYRLVEMQTEGHCWKMHQQLCQGLMDGRRTQGGSVCSPQQDSTRTLPPS